MARNFQERASINSFNNNDLQERYRVNNAALAYLTNELDLVLRTKTFRNHSLPSAYKILITLRYLATGNIQLNTGDLHHIAQSSVSRVVSQTIDALSSPQMCARHIKFPTTQEALHQNKEGFFRVARFPNVIGVIDGTHVQLTAPTKDEATFVNRMGLFLTLMTRSLMLLHDSQGQHTTVEFFEQVVFGKFLRASYCQQVSRCLLGDSGYPCKRWLLTPYLQPANQSQESYNRSHKSTSCKVERGIGQFKRRWGILQGEVRLSPEKTCKVILACAVLHNICKAHNVLALDAFHH